MSQRLTLATIKASRIPTVLNVCPTDPRLLNWINEAQERLLAHGRWLGAYQKANFCVTDDCFVLPREIGTVERLSLCGMSIPIAGQWAASYLGSVSSCSSCSSCGSCSDDCSCDYYKAQDAGTRVSFNSTTANDKKLKMYLSNILDIGKKVIFQGYDSNGIWVRTLIDGVTADGEQVTLANPSVTTATVWAKGSPTGIIKDPTAGRVLLYSLSTVDATERFLGSYQPSETLPQFQAMKIAGLSGANCCGCTTDDDGITYRTVSAIVSLQHIPIEVDNDWLIFQSLSAYKEAMIAVKAWEEGEETKANFHFYGTQNSPKNGRNAMRVVNRGGAIPLLQAELRKATGDRTEVNVQLEATDSMARAMVGFR